MAKVQNTENVPAVRGSSEIAQLDELERLLVSGERTEVVEDPALMTRQVIEQLLAAESDEELFSSGQAIGWRNLLGLPVELNGFRWRPSSFEEGSNVFFVVFGKRMDNGEPVVLTTGASGILAQLVNLARRGRLVGAVVKMVEADKPTRSGYKPLRLELVQPAPSTDAA